MAHPWRVSRSLVTIVVAGLEFEHRAAPLNRGSGRPLVVAAPTHALEQAHEVVALDRLGEEAVEPDLAPGIPRW